MTSIVVAAHDEATVLGRCLDALLPGGFDVTVVANGCTDDTAAVASARAGVRVVELPEPGKAAALNAGDAVAVGFPRIYLDADVVLSVEAVRALADALSTAPAATVGRRLDLSGRPLAVRAYYAVHSRLPALRSGLFGRGVVALSADGRARFDSFPLLVADDLFLDSLFTDAEKAHVTAYGSLVSTPRRTADLVRRLVRVRAGNAALRASGHSASVRSADRLAWLRDVVLRRPWLAPAAAVYVGLTVTAALAARRARDGGMSWARDESTRVGQA